MVRTYPHYNPFCVPIPEKLVWAEVFRDSSLPLDLEIGSSNGRWLLQYAVNYPERNILGLETRNKYVEATLNKIIKSELGNVHILRANANTALKVLFEEQKLQNVFIMFPDPWYKKKHLKRRVINQQFLAELYQLMQKGGELHIATDKGSFADEIMTELQQSRFKNKFTGFAEENISGIISEIEDFHLKNKNSIYRLVFLK
jgi:tRNA (guanine-N7-)-methyltransferase